MIMKKYLLAALSAFALVTTSCTNEDDGITGGLTPDLEANGVELSLSANMESYASSTRATVDVNGTVGTFKWATGDAISLLMSSGKFRELTLTPESDGQTSGTFKGTVKETETVGSIAVYPHSDKHTATTVHLPATYGTVAKEHTTNTHAIMRANITNVEEGIAFHHLASVLCIRFKDVPVGVDEFVFSTFDRNITGNFFVADNGGNEKIQLGNSQGSGNTVTYKFRALAAKQDMTFYIPLPVGTYIEFSVELKQGDFSIFFYSTGVKENKVERASLIVMPELTIVEHEDEGEGYTYIEGAAGMVTYFINNANGLQAVGQLLSVAENPHANITLMNDITLPSPVDEESSNWTPISEGYMGTFDGNGHSITGLVVKPTSGKAGLIAQPDGGFVGGAGGDRHYSTRVKGLTLINPIIISKNDNAGAIIGGNTHATVTDCHVIGGRIEGNTAGAISAMNNMSARIIGCTVTDTEIKSTQLNGGGIAGTNTTDGKIIGCYTKNVNVISALNAGGIAGLSTSSQFGGGQIYGCYSEGCVFKEGNVPAVSDRELQNLFGKHVAGYKNTPVTYDSYYKKDGTYHCVAGDGINVAVTSTTTDWAVAAAAMNAAIAKPGVTDYKWDTNEVRIVKK